MHYVTRETEECERRRRNKKREREKRKRDGGRDGWIVSEGDFHVFVFINRTAGKYRQNEGEYLHMFVCVCVCVSECVSVCVCLCVCMTKKERQSAASSINCTPLNLPSGVSDFSTEGWTAQCLRNVSEPSSCVWTDCRAPSTLSVDATPGFQNATLFSHHTLPPINSSILT